MKRFFVLLSSFILVVISFSAFFHFSKNEPAPDASVTLEIPDKIPKTLTSEAKHFIQKHKFNNSICFLIDMSLESGQDRFFLYDPSTDSILDKGLVTHGRCNEAWLTGRRYGNEIGCGCTSLGKYKIGQRYNGTFGLAYKLHGLDSTNANAFKRFVVLHAHECVPDDEVHPYPICQSDGCPTVSKKFLTKLALVIDTSSRPILLWIYD
jgi:hypothetical protein